MFKVTYRRRVCHENIDDVVFEKTGSLPALPKMGGGIIIDRKAHQVQDVVLENNRMDILIVIQGLTVLYKNTYNRLIKDIKKDGWVQRDIK